MSYYSSSSKKKTETTSSGASGKAVASRTAWGEFQKQLKSDEMKLLASRKSPILTNTVVSSKPSSSADYSREVCLEGGNSSEQAEALLAMGMALNSVEWVEKSGWDSSTSLSQFFGIGVDPSDEDPRVRSIQLPQNSLSGSLAACPLHLFSNTLKFVDISNNPDISGELRSFGTCPLIEVLNCQRCRGVTGGLEMLITCTRIQVLNLEGTGVKGSLSPLATFGTNLRMLNMRETEIDVTNLRKLESLTKLQQLSLGSTATPLGYDNRVRDGPEEFDDDFLSLWFRPLSALKLLHVLDLHSPLPARRHTTAELGRELACLTDLRAVYLRSIVGITGRAGVTLDGAPSNETTKLVTKDAELSTGASGSGGAAMVSLFSQSSKLSKQEQVLKEEQAVLDRCIAKLRQAGGLKPDCLVYWTKVW